MTFLKNIFKKSTKVETELSSNDDFFTKHKDKLYPWIKVLLSENDLRLSENVVELKEDDQPVFKKWLGDLVINYVFDMGGSFQVLLNRDVPNTISADELHALAVENLNRDTKFTLHDTNFGGYMLTAGGNHEAGSICLPELWQWLTEHLGDSLVVAIPSKDLVLILPKTNTDKIENLKAFVQDIFKTGERLLTRNIFEYNKDTTEWTIIDSVSV
jgi:uncharacterized protein YtpQ (UPF0354 family)